MKNRYRSKKRKRSEKRITVISDEWFVLLQFIGALKIR